MRDLLIHIHGFLSSSDAARFHTLKKYVDENCLDVEVISPRLSDTPKEAVDFIEQLINDEKSSRRSIALIGHSLGGYFATYLASRYGLKTVLVNPVVRGYEIMCEFFGECHNPHTGKDFHIGEEDIAYLVSIHVEDMPDRSLFMVMQQLDDEITDPEEVFEYYKGCKLITETGGLHEFSNFEKHVGLVFDFLYGSTRRGGD